MEKEVIKERMVVTTRLGNSKYTNIQIKNYTNTQENQMNDKRIKRAEQPQQVQHNHPI